MKCRIADHFAELQTTTDELALMHIAYLLTSEDWRTLKQRSESQGQLFDWITGSNSWEDFETEFRRRREELEFDTTVARSQSIASRVLSPLGLRAYEACLRDVRNPGVHVWTDYVGDEHVQISVYFNSPDDGRRRLVSMNSTPPTFRSTLPSSLTGDYSGSVTITRFRNQELIFNINVGEFAADPVCHAAERRPLWERQLELGDFALEKVIPSDFDIDLSQVGGSVQVITKGQRVGTAYVLALIYPPNEVQRVSIQLIGGRARYKSREGSTTGLRVQIFTEEGITVDRIVQDLSTSGISLVHKVPGLDDIEFNWKAVQAVPSTGRFRIGLSFRSAWGNANGDGIRYSVGFIRVTEVPF